MGDELLRVGEPLAEGSPGSLLRPLMAVWHPSQVMAPRSDRRDDERAKARAEAVLIDPNSDCRVAPAIDGRHLDV
jgi:hypothetical protein